MKKFEGLVQWHCNHISFELCTIFQSERTNELSEILVVGARLFLFVNIAKTNKTFVRLGFSIFFMRSTVFRRMIRKVF